jgi:16S rRNA (uracil1498-N3)-methyltransferase
VSLPLFFVDELAEPGHQASLSVADTRHALRSLRMRPGDSMTLTDGRGLVATGRLIREDRGRALVDIGHVRAAERPAPTVSVALAPPKGDRLAWAVQKLGELGVDQALLVATGRSVRGWSAERTASSLSRLRTVAREAAMQSRRPFTMDVRVALTLEEALDGAEVGRIALWERAPRSLTDVLAPKSAGPTRILVGPEGGFTEEEVDRMKGAGAALASLGSGILRTETAAVVGAALVLARFGRLG